MKKQITNASTLLEHYNFLTAMFDEPSGKHASYLSAREYHDNLLRYLPLVDTFTEFGIMQGHTIAAAMLNGVNAVSGYDIDLKWYSPSAHVFEEYANAHGIDLKIFEVDTATCDIIARTDMLHIDSLHTYEHCSKELQRHAKQVRKYILFHDTNIPGVWRAITEFLEKNLDWRIDVRNVDGVGFAVIKKEHI